MTLFIFFALIFLAVTLVILILPLISPLSSSQPSNATAAKLGSNPEAKTREAEILRTQLAELTQEKKWGALSEEAHAEAIQELKARALAELDLHSQSQLPATLAKGGIHQTNGGAHYSGAADGQEFVLKQSSEWRTIAVLTLFFVLVAPAMYVYVVGAPLLLTMKNTDLGMNQTNGAQTSSESVASAKGNTEQLALVESMVAKLALSLEKDPSNLEGWAMLGRSYKYLNRPLEAQKAFQRTGSLLDTDANLLVEYAEVVSDNKLGDATGLSDQLLNKAYALAPKNPSVLWSSGALAFQRGNYALAVERWESLRKLIPAEEVAAAKGLSEAIASARTHAGMKEPNSSDGKTEPSKKQMPAVKSTPTAKP